MENNKVTSSQNTDLLGDSYRSFVNLDHRVDRLEKMTKNMEMRNFTAVRTRGIMPSEIVDKKVSASRLQVMLARTPGAIGCHFAQVAVMEEAERQGKHAWVMEDDLKFCADLPERIAHMNKFCDTHPWDIIWLGGTFHINPPYWHKDHPLARDAECTDDPRMMRTYGCFCTYAYIVNRTSLRKVLEGLDSLLERSMGIDWAMIQLQPALHTYAYVPGCFTQYDNMSDIGKGMTRFSGFAKLGPYWFAKHIEDFDPTTHNWHEANLEQQAVEHARRDIEEKAERDEQRRLKRARQV